MPYEKVRDGENWIVKNKDTGRVVATHEPPDAEEKAERQIHLLESIENDPEWEENHD